MKKLIILLILLSPIICLAQTRPHWLQIQGTPYVDIRTVGMKTTNSASANRTAFDTAIANNIPLLIPSGTFLIDNDSTSVPITLDNMAIVGVGPQSKLEFTSYEKSGLLVTGDDFTLSNLSIIGEGTLNTATATWFNVEDRLALVACGATGSAVVHRPLIQNCYFENPAINSVQFYKVVGGRILNNNFTSDNAILPSGIYSALTYPAHIHVAISANTIVSGNTIHGVIQGIVGGGNVLIPIDAGDGETASGYLRHTIITNNVVSGTKDHGIYLSDVSTRAIIKGNTVWSTNDAIKFEGQFNVISNNECSSNASSIINGRNCSNLSITDNQCTNYGTGQYVGGIYLGGTESATDFQNINITGNVLVAVNGGAGSGILVNGEPDATTGDHNRIANLNISNNIINGFCGFATANPSYYGGIQVKQVYEGSSPASMAIGLTISGNTIRNQSTAAAGGSGILIRNGAEEVTISGNTISNIRGFGSAGAGIILHAVSKATVTGNTFEEDPLNAVAGTIGIAELLPRSYGAITGVLSLATGTYNVYSGNNCGTKIGVSVLMQSSTSVNRDKKSLYLDDAVTGTIVSYSNYEHLAVNASAAITITPIATEYPFPRWHTLTIGNVSATATVTFNGVDILASESQTFMQIDAGTGADGLANTWVSY